MYGHDGCTYIGSPKCSLTTAESAHLINVSPVLAVVVEPLPEHTHHETIGLDVVRVLGQLSHERTARPPGVIGGRFTNFGLCI